MLINCDLFEIPSFNDDRGGLSILEEQGEVPFMIQRIYYIYNTKVGVTRGVHAHKKLQQVILAFSGIFEVTLDDGDDRQTFLLDRPNLGLYVCPMIWREVTPLKNNSVCGVIASRRYEPDDYIHDYYDFLNIRNST